MNFRPNAAATFATVLLLGCSSSSAGGSGNSTPGSSGGSGSSGGGSGSGGSSGSGSGGGIGSTDEGGASDTGELDATRSSTDAAVGACPAGVLGHCDQGASYPQYPGYALALVEDFPTPVDLDEDPIFTWSDGSPADGQTRFREEQISFSNGKMIITAESKCPSPAAPCIPSSVSYAEPALNSASGMTGPMNVWSGEFRTKYNNYRYGHYEVRYHAPSSNPGHETSSSISGDFLSTMFAFRTPKWQTWNEIDLELEPNIPTSVAFNVINATGATSYPGGNAAASNTQTEPPSSAAGTSALSGYKNIDSHTYAFEWTPTSVTWFLDGVMIHQFAGTANDPIPTKSVKIMMNLWIFAQAANSSATAFGDPTNNKYPFSAEYEYFRFYKWNQETTYPCSPTPSCLSAADTADSRNNAKETNYPN